MSSCPTLRIPIALLVFACCESEEAPTDAGSVLAPRRDSGSRDADEGTDSGQAAVDAGADLDASADGGSRPDGGDGGSVFYLDAGAGVDASPAPDGGDADAGDQAPPWSDAVDCWDRSGYVGTTDDYLSHEVWCSQFVSRFDGATDAVYLHFPPGYDNREPVPVIFWFRAMGQSEGPISDPRMFDGTETFEGVPALYGAILIGVGQRGDCNFLGDLHGLVECEVPDDAREAAKLDVLELTNQLASRFHVSHIFAAGASMGGYVPLRLNQLFPDRFSGAIASAPAICAWGTAPPTCTGALAAGSQAIYDAAEAGIYDDKLVYAVVGTEDTVEGLLAGNRYLDGILDGRSWFRYAEIAGAGHANFFADDYNVETLGLTAWLVDNPAVPRLEEDVASFIAEHPVGSLDPRPGWAPPGPEGWYLTDRILEYGGRPFVSGTP